MLLFPTTSYPLLTTCCLLCTMGFSLPTTTESYAYTGEAYAKTKMVANS